MALSKKLKDLRSSKNLTLEEVAQRAGLTKSFISQIERGVSAPSLTSLRKIASVLGVNISYCFEDADRIRDERMVRKNKRKILVSKRLKHELLIASLENKKMQPVLVTAEIGACIESAPRTHEGEEFFIQLKGKQEVIVGEDKYILEEGDSIYYDATMPHMVKNIGGTKSVALWVITPPRFLK